MSADDLPPTEPDTDPGDERRRGRASGVEAREGSDAAFAEEGDTFHYGVLEARPDQVDPDISQGPHYHYLLEFCHTHPGSHEKRPANWRQEHVVDLDADQRTKHRPLPHGFEDFLESRVRFGVKVGLDNIRALLARLHLDRGLPPTLIVAGTNGKGTVAHALGEALAIAGYRPGVYTSPHVEHFLERIQVSNADPDEEALEGACVTVRHAVEALDADGVHCTYFEVGTALALDVFRRQRASPLVLEVGMGGRGDAVNAVRATATVITNVGSDHAEHLGTTLAERAREKAGIMRPAVPCFTAAQGEALRHLEREAIERGTPLVPVLPAAPGRDPEEAGLALVRTLLGDRRIHKVLPRLRDLDATTVRLPRLPGRREPFFFADGRRVLLDVAHNSEALASLADLLDEAGGDAAGRVLLTGLLEGKPPEAVAALAGDRFAAVHVTRPLGDRARSAAALADALAAEGVVVEAVEEDPVEALRAALGRLPDDGLLVVAGSFYLAAAVRPHLRRAARRG